MRVYQYIHQTKAEGPGNRFAIWVQGCPHKCPGCFEKDTWDSYGGFELSLEEVIGEFNKAAGFVDGVTILGGEPFEQAEELAEFAEYVRQSGKTVITFTGYTYVSLQARSDLSIDKLLRNTDILMDGEYVQALRDFSRPMVGSQNQNIIFLSDRIPMKEYYSYKNSIEVRMSPNGRIRINGMGDFDKIRKEIGG